MSSEIQSHPARIRFTVVVVLPANASPTRSHARPSGATMAAPCTSARSIRLRRSAEDRVRAENTAAFLGSSAVATGRAASGVSASVAFMAARSTVPPTEPSRARSVTASAPWIQASTGSRIMPGGVSGRAATTSLKRTSIKARVRAGSTAPAGIRGSQ